MSNKQNIAFLKQLLSGDLLNIDCYHIGAYAVAIKAGIEALEEKELILNKEEN